MDDYCYLRTVHDKVAADKTANEKRCGVKFDGLLIPCGANVSYKPISSKDEARLHQCGKPMLPRIFVGVRGTCGGGESGDLLIAADGRVETV